MEPYYYLNKLYKKQLGIKSKLHIKLWNAGVKYFLSWKIMKLLFEREVEYK